MPPRDPRITQLDNPELVAALIADLEIIGQVGLLGFIPEVSPVFIVGSRGLSINNEPPAFQSAEIFDGAVFAPAVNTVLADTGQLAAGIFDIFANISSAGVATAGTGASIALEHRNAANNATLAVLLQIAVTTVGNNNWGNLPQTGYTIAQDERLRAIVLTQAISGAGTASIGARLRPVP